MVPLTIIVSPLHIREHLAIMVSAVVYRFAYIYRLVEIIAYISPLAAFVVPSDTMRDKGESLREKAYRSAQAPFL